MRQKYRNPPINELIIGLYFDQDIPSFRIEHLGLFWSTLRDDFPVVRQQSALVAPPIGSSIPFSFELTTEFPMPRFWLEAKDGSTIMQIQRNAFLFNWRKRDQEYPHFGAVKSAFDRNLLRFSDFLETEVGASLPNLQIAELTYVNVIEESEYWRGPQDTSKVFPRFQLPTPNIAEQTPVDFHQATTQKLASDLTLTTSIRSGTSTTHANPVLIFELRTLGLLGAATKADADLWFDRAHVIIGECFTAMTNSDIQNRYWQPV